MDLVRHAGLNVLGAEELDVQIPQVDSLMLENGLDVSGCHCVCTPVVFGLFESHIDCNCLAPPELEFLMDVVYKVSVDVLNFL